MLNIQHIIFNQGIIHIINRRPDICSICCSVFQSFQLKVLCIDNGRCQNSGNFLLQNMIGNALQIRINGEIYIISGRWFFSGIFINIQNLSHGIYINRFWTVFTLELGLHGFLYPGFSNHRIQRIILVSLLFQIFQFLGICFSGVADNGSHALCFIIHTNRIFRNIHALQLIFTLHDFCHSLFTDIGCHGYRNIFFKTVGWQNITDFCNFQGLFRCKSFRKSMAFQFFFCIRLFLIHQCKPFFTAHVFHKFFCWSV